MTSAKISQYRITADRNTGEWIGWPEFIDFVDQAHWSEKVDTDEVHYETYDEAGETRAIEVRWAADVLPIVTSHFTNWGASACQFADHAGFVEFREGFEALHPDQWTPAENWVDQMNDAIGAWRSA